VGIDRRQKYVKEAGYINLSQEKNWPLNLKSLSKMYKLRLIKDNLARHWMLSLTILCLLLLFIIGAGLLIKSIPVLKEKSLLTLLTTSSWKPFKGEFGFLTFIVSTLYVTAIAILIALPLSLLSSIYLSEYASVRIRRIFSPVVDLLAGIPPVVYGVWVH
jgi:phosphate transport system permease protein